MHPISRLLPQPLAVESIDVIGLRRGDELWVILYDEATKPEALRTLGRWAANPELSFTWYDAAVLSQRINQPYPTPPPTGSPTP